MGRRLDIVFEHRPQGVSAEGWWLKSAAAEGFEASMLYADENPRPRRADMVLMRCYDTPLALGYRALGVQVVNTPESMELCRDKYRTCQVLAEAGLPTPTTVRDTEHPATTVGDPYIVKPNVGSKGEGVELVHAADNRPLPHGFIAQRFIESSRGRDIRVWVVDGRAVAAVVRSNPSKVVSNFAAGGTATLFESPRRQEVYALAEAAARACGLFFAGVDILFGPDGAFIICEVNGNAGFRTLSLVGGPDILASLMHQLALKSV